MSALEPVFIGAGVGVIIAALIIGFLNFVEALRELKMDREIFAARAAEMDATENHKPAMQGPVAHNWVFVTVMATWAIVILSGDLIASLHPWLSLLSLVAVDWDGSAFGIYAYVATTGLIAWIVGMALNNAHNHSKGDA